VALAVVIVSFVGTARVASAGGDDEKQARALYERAEKSFDVGKFSEALTDYQAAYEAKPLPGFLFNIAQCYRNMGNFERARFFFRRYLTLDPKAPNRRRVDELIAEMSKQLDAQAAAAATAPPTTPPAAEAAPTAPPATAAPAPATAAPTAPPAAPVETTAATAAPVLVATPAAPSEPSEPHRPMWKRWWFWTGVGAVVAGGVVAGILLSRPETVTPGTLSPIDGR